MNLKVTLEMYGNEMDILKVVSIIHNTIQYIKDFHHKRTFRSVIRQKKK